MDPIHDIAAVTEMLQAVIDDIGNCKARVKCVAVLTMLGQEVWDPTSIWRLHLCASTYLAQTHIGPTVGQQ